MTNTPVEKTATEFLVERLAELSANIPVRMPKAARERAEGVASSYIKAEKTRLEDELRLWAFSRILEDMPAAERRIWENYQKANAAMIARFKSMGSFNGTLDGAMQFVRFESFVTGKRVMSGNGSYKDALDRAMETVTGYAMKRKLVDAKLAELDRTMDATKKAIWRSYQNREAKLADNSATLVDAVASIMKQVVGVPALAAPAVVPEVVS